MWVCGSEGERRGRELGLHEGRYRLGGKKDRTGIECEMSVERKRINGGKKGTEKNGS